MTTTKWNYCNIFGIHVFFPALSFFIYKLFKKAIHLEHCKPCFFNKKKFFKIPLQKATELWAISYIYLFFDNMFSQISVSLYLSQFNFIYIYKENYFQELLWKVP